MTVPNVLNVPKAWAPKREARRRLLIVLALLVLGVLEVHAQKSGVIVGQVVDGVTGKPIDAAIVTLSGPQLIGARQPPKVLTDAGGRFIFARLEAGLYTVVATKGGYAEGEPGRRRPGGGAPPVSVNAGDAPVNVSVPMWRYSAIAGTVVDETGEPVVNLQVHVLKRRAGAAAPSKVATTFTDDRGIYRFDSLLPGDYLVVTSPTPAAHRRVYPATFPPSSVAVAEAPHVTLGSGEERAAVDIQIAPAPASRVAGVVMNAGRSAAGTTVTLTPAGPEALPPGVLSWTTSSDETGAFTFDGVAAGRYQIHASANGSNAGGWADLPVAVTDQDVAGITVNLNPTLRISGRARFEGATPAPGSRGNLSFTPTPFLLEPADRAVDRIATSGSMSNSGFTISGYPAGRYRLQVNPPSSGWTLKAAVIDGVDVSDTAFDLTHDADLELVFTDRPTRLTGHVDSAADPSNPAIAGATVLLFTSDLSAWADASAGSRRFRSARVDRRGEFVINDVPPGTYCVLAVPEDEPDWPNPEALERFAREATLVSLGDGETKAVALTIKDKRK